MDQAKSDVTRALYRLRVPRGLNNKIGHIGGNMSAGVVLVMGLPATGKTTLAKHFELHEAKRWSFDDFANLDSLKEKSILIFNQVSQLLKSTGGIHIIDDTMHLGSMRKPYMRFCQQGM